MKLVNGFGKEARDCGATMYAGERALRLPHATNEWVLRSCGFILRNWLVLWHPDYRPMIGHRYPGRKRNEGPIRQNKAPFHEALMVQSLARNTPHPKGLSIRIVLTPHLPEKPRSRTGSLAVRRRLMTRRNGTIPCENGDH